MTLFTLALNFAPINDNVAMIVIMRTGKTATVPLPHEVSANLVGTWMVIGVLMSESLGLS